MEATIPMEWVEGVDDVTLWLWTDDPDPVTVRWDHETWEAIKQKADGDVEGYITRKIADEIA